MGVFSCSNNEPKEHQSEKHLDIHIENGLGQGFQYSDFRGNKYLCRYYTTTIINNSIAPIHIEISLSKKYNDSLKSKIFLFPKALTKKMPNEIKLFLDRDIDTPIWLDEIINPNKSYVVRFGTLTDVKYNSSNVTLKTAAKTSSTLSLELNIDSDLKDNSNDFIIPCGQISFTNN